MRTSLPTVPRRLWAIFCTGLLLTVGFLVTNSSLAQCSIQFANEPSVQTGECGENLSFGPCSDASSSCCDGPVEVTSFTSETGNVIESCSVSTAFGPGVDWSFWFPDLAAPSVAWHFSGPANLELYGDGTGHLTGTIVNSANNTLMMSVDLWLHNGKNWTEWSALGRGYKDDLQIAGTTHFDWKYYELKEGYANVTGLGSLAGTSLHLHHMPANFYYGFQAGMAANNKNANNGFSGWFTYDGTYNGQTVVGHGDVNVDRSCTGDDGCGSTAFTRICRAEDACGNVDYQSDLIILEDTTNPFVVGEILPVQLPCEDYAGVFIEADDACSSIVITYTDEIIEEGCGGSVLRHYVITDGCGNAITAEQMIYLTGEEAAVFTVFPEDTQIECSQIDNLPSPDVQWEGGCSNVQLNITENTIPGQCAGTYQIVYTYTLTDDCDNVTTQDWVVSVVDTTPPQLFNIPGDISIECGDDVPTVDVFAIDACGAEVNVSLSAVTEQLGCGYLFIRTWTATDACGNVSEGVQVITVEDHINPIFSFVPPNTIVNCDEPIVLDSALVDDQCSATYVESVDVPLEDCGGSFIRIWRAFDGCGNQAIQSTIVTVVDNFAPSMTSFPQDVVVECGEIPSVESANIAYEDNCSETIDVQYIEMTNGESCATGVTIQRVWILTDECGNTSEWVWTIFVQDSEAPVLVGVPSNLNLNCGDDYETPVVTATDNCSESLEPDYTEYTVPNSCGYNLIRQWTVRDLCGNETIANQVISFTDNQNPVFDFVPEDVYITCGQNISIDDLPLATATDDCGSVEITFEDFEQGATCGDGVLRVFTATDACGNTATAEQIIAFSDFEAPQFSNVPEDVILDCGADVILQDPTVTDDCSVADFYFVDDFTGGCSGSFVRTYYAIDACGNESSVSVTVLILDDIAPEVTAGPESGLYECGSVPTVDEAGFEFYDNCGAVEVTYVGETEERFCGGTSLITRTWVFSDECGNSTEYVWTLNVVDTSAPSFIGVPEDATITCNDQVSDAVVFANDACSGELPVTLTAETIPMDCGYQFVRTWSAIDECGNVGTASQVITVIDTDAPEFTFVPEQVYVECGSQPQLLDAEAFDGCSTWSISEQQEPLVDCAGSYLRIFTATDGCGNSTTAEQAVIFEDTQSPIPSLVPSNMTVSCSQIPAVDENYVTFTDECSNDLSIDFTVDTIELDCANNYVLIYTWSAQDACGNVDIENLEITVLDNEAPVFVTEFENMQLTCGDDIPTIDAVATDLCGIAEVSFIDYEFPLPCGYVVERTWTATDACGNATNAFQTFTFEDTTGPELSDYPADIYLSCDDFVPDVPEITAFDACGGESFVFFYEDFIDGACPSDFTVVRTWVSTDYCDNETTHTQYIYFVDTQAPQFFAYEPIIEIPCTSINNSFVVAYDNCNAVELTYSDELVGTGCSGSIVRTYYAEDACGNWSTAEQIIQLFDTDAPEFTSFPEDVVVECNNIPSSDSPLIEYQDNCSATDISVSEDIIDGLCINEYTIVRTYTISDECGNEFSQSWTIQVQDNSAPDLIGVPQDVVIDCMDDIPAADVFAIDNCASEAFLSLSANTEFTECGYIFTRTWTAIDECGNISTASQVVTVSDFFAPVLSETPADLTIPCGTTPPAAPSITALDACMGEVEVVYSEQITNNTNCPTFTRTWCAVDCAGNEVCHVQTITSEINNGLAYNPNVPTMAVKTKSAGIAQIMVEAGEAGQWKVDIYDINGRLITPLFEGYLANGEVRTYDVNADSYSEAIYLVRFTNGAETITKRMALMN